jgi:hypothetical protein
MENRRDVVAQDRRPRHRHRRAQIYLRHEGARDAVRQGAPSPFIRRRVGVARQQSGRSHPRSDSGA